MKSLKLLLIDDDPDDQDLFAETIRGFRSNTECVMALNGQIGLDKLLIEKLRPDLIFLDLNMPVMNGSQFLEAFKNQSSLLKIPIVILSTSISRIAIPEGINIKTFLTKPDTFAGWEETIKITLGLTGA